MMMDGTNGSMTDGRNNDHSKQVRSDVLSFGNNINHTHEIVTNETITPQSISASSTTLVVPKETAHGGGGGNDHSWRDSSGGEGSVTLCCSRCCSPLGFAPITSPETWRLWKHRLSTMCIQDVPITEEGKVPFGPATSLPWSSTNTTMKMSPPTPLGVLVAKPLSSCSSFLARELIRYAEMKAIFTFVIRCEQTKAEMIDTMNTHNVRKNCLLLRLLSWETSIATSFVDSSVQASPFSSEFSTKVKLEKVAKIVYEEAIDPTTIFSANNGQNIDSPDGTTTVHHQQWIWGGVDLCCLPQQSSSQTPKATSTAGFVTALKDGRSSSAVQLQLPKEEYQTVIQDLTVGSRFFNRDVTDATMLLKMGGIWEGLGLSALFI
jgi:hypothetical protein